MQLEAWSSELLGRPVRIANIRAGWLGWRPDLKLENVAVLAEDGRTELLRFAEISADVAPLRSLANRQPTLVRLRLRGVALTVLNPGDEPVAAKLGAGSFKPTRASRTTLAGEASEALPVSGGSVGFTVGPRAWVRIALG